MHVVEHIAVIHVAHARRILADPSEEDGGDLKVRRSGEHTVSTAALKFCNLRYTRHHQLYYDGIG